LKRIEIAPRQNWQEAVEKLGFGFHSTNVPYWDESAYYSFSATEICSIEKATALLWKMCLAAVEHVIQTKSYSLFAIPPAFVPLIEKSWNEDHPSIYGRFDLVCNQGKIKMLEFNADTPTSLFEAGIVQWFWLKDFDDTMDQFNGIHERLIDYWKYLSVYLYPYPLHFSCVKQSLEDLTNTEYMRDCAIQAGLKTKLVFMDDIGWNEEERVFTDLENLPVKNLFKLYPWEWLSTDGFSANILTDKNRIFWIEPSWKMILSNKAILPVLWELFPDHPNLLPAFFEEKNMNEFVKKPILSREGANIDIVSNGRTIESSPGEYGQEGFIYQEYFPLPVFDGNHYPLIGSWVIGQEASGMGIRESNRLITDNLSRFIPHLIER
jgi:glutathionylspermidine synthase